MSSLYLFDVDDTLEVSGGPVKITDLVDLKNKGHTVGLCGNWSVAVNRITNWQVLFSCVGPVDNTGSKAPYMRQLMTYLPKYDRYILVGNITPSTDSLFAAQAGYEFILEKDFAEGTR